MCVYAISEVSVSTTNNAKKDEPTNINPKGGGGGIYIRSSSLIKQVLAGVHALAFSYQNDELG